MAKKLLSKLFRRSAAAPRPDTDVINTISLHDKFSSYPSNGLTPQRLTGILKEADQGNLTRLAELFQEVATKDPDLFAVLNARKRAVTKLDYDVIAASDDSKDVEIKDYISAQIENIKGFNDALGDLLDAVPRGLSVSQIIWAINDEGNVVVERLEHCVQKNFRYGRASDPKASLNEIRRITDENLVDGLELEPNKWIVHEVKATSGYATQVQLMRTVLWMYLFKNFGWKAFVVYCEVFGLPLRLGKYPSGTVDEKALNELRTAVRSLGTDAAGIFPDNMVIEIIESAKSGGTQSVHEKLIELAIKSYSKAILGHTGTSESTPGKLGSEDAAKDVKLDLVSADAEALSFTLSDQLIRPWVIFQFGPQEKYPYFRFAITEPEDLEKSIRVLETAQRMGKPIPADWFGKKFGIPDAGEDEEVLEAQQQPTMFPTKGNVIPFESSIAKGLLGEKHNLFQLYDESQPRDDPRRQK